MEPAVDGDGIHESPPVNGDTDAVDVSLDRKLGRVDADHCEAVIAVPLVPRSEVRSGADPVDAGERPEIDEDYATAQVRRRQRLGIEPLGCAVERRYVALVRQAGVIERGRP